MGSFASRVSTNTGSMRGDYHGSSAAVLPECDVRLHGEVPPRLLAPKMAFVEPVIAALVLSDLFDEWLARRVHGALAMVHPLQRLAEVEPVLHVLRQARIPCFSSSDPMRRSRCSFRPNGTTTRGGRSMSR